MCALPTGTVTFLFTDIEGSTALAQQFPSELPALLARHHAILQHAIQAHQGHVFRIIGDAFCAAFYTAGDALLAALDAQRGLQHEAWHPAPIKVRMGLHTGSAQAGAIEESAGDYVGYLTLTRVQRVMSTAHGEQVLLSNPSAELVRGELPAAVTLRDMGEHRLKGLVNLEHLWQLVTPDLRQDFPPLATLNAIPNNLPVQLTSFIGRETDITEVKQLLSASRLVTLTGSGGAGKTRLSLQVAAEVIDDFAQGVWFVELAPLTDPTLIPQTAASVLGLREEQGRPLTAILADYLQAKTALLILDNCEHLIAVCAQFADTLLHAAPQVKILASSREVLDIGGEAAYRVPSLSIPDPQRLPSLATLTQYEAVKLFIDRARAVLPSFQVNNSNAPAVAQICYHLDGIPLAIELAAARVRGLQVEQIAQRLDDRFRLLTGGGRTALPRHQTLRAMIDWSHSLLTEQERLLFRRLSVFAGGWSIEAAEAVCAGQGLASTDVLDLLLHLVNKSLILLAEQSDETRYRMLETLREYARERLLESGEAEAIQNEHLAFFLELAEEAEPKLRGIEQIAWFKRLEIGYDNIRAALKWSQVEPGHEDAGLRLGGALAPSFWTVHGYFREGQSWLEQALTTGGGAPPALRAKALRGTGTMASYQGDLQSAIALYKESLALYQALGDERGIAQSLLSLGIAALCQGDYEQAMSLLQEGLKRCRELGDKFDTARALNNLGEVARHLGDLEGATARYEESLVLYRELGGKWSIAFAIQNLGLVAAERSDFVRALQLQKESLALYQEVGDKGGFPESLEKLADVLGAQQHPERAARLLGAAEALREAIHMPVLPCDRTDYERTVVAVRAQLDEVNFASAWAAGRAMRPEQAIEYALEQPRTD
jgi:predicted ATPase/class 3 adenylate cyclase